MSKSKQKGTTAETAVVRYLEEKTFEAVRNPLQGSNDQGDVKIFGMPVVIEVKNCRTMKLSEWVDEAQNEKANAKAEVGVVWHKRVRQGSPSGWYVTMTGEDFVKLLDFWRD